jgi:hypothetical protein
VKRLLVALTFLTGVSAFGADGEAVDAERVKALVRQLGSEEFDEREAATEALKKAGEGAWPLVAVELTSNDEERRTRAKELESYIGTFLTDVEREQARKFTVLLESKDEMQRAQGLDGLVAMGGRGIRALRKHVSGAGVKPRVEMKLDKTVFYFGEKVTGDATFTNESDAALWRRSLGVGLTHATAFVQPFGEERKRLLIKRHGGSRATGMRGGYYNPIRGWMAVLPGEGETVPINTELSRVGIYTVTATYEVPEAQEIWPLLNPPKDEAQNVDDLFYPVGASGEGCFALHMGAAWKDKERKFAQEQRIFVLPATPWKNDDGQLRLTLERDAGAPADLRVKARFESLANDETLVLESGVLRYAWYALLNAEKVPVKWGTLKSVLAGEVPEALRTIEAKAKFEIKLAMPLPEQAGEYSLLVCYADGFGGDTRVVVGRELRLDLLDLNALQTAKADGKVTGYGGKLCAELRGIVVPKK